jgi:hypothetical protein
LALHIAHTSYLFDLFNAKFNYDGIDENEVMNAILLHDMGSGLDQTGNMVPFSNLANDNHNDKYSHSRDAMNVAKYAGFKQSVQDAAYLHHEDK